MYAPHVVNPPMTIDPDEAVRAFLEELGDDVPLCECPCCDGRPAKWRLSPCPGCQATTLACKRCKRDSDSWVAAQCTEIECTQCHFHPRSSVWIKL